MDSRLWAAFQTSPTFLKWYHRRLNTFSNNVYEFRSRKKLDLSKFNTHTLPTVQNLSNFVLSLGGTMQIDISSVELNPVITCSVQLGDIKLSRTCRTLTEAVELAVCEFALEYDIRKGG